MTTVIEINALKNYLGGHWVHNSINLSVQSNEIVGIIGGSGSGKTVLLRSILTLLKPTAGCIEVFNTDIMQCSIPELMAVQHRWGVMFQRSALFSALSVLENVMYPLQVFTKLSKALIKDIALLKIALTGLPLQAAEKYPSELSGGMLKRAALARAIALDPELLFLDEPTAGLDPYSAGALDELILHLREALGLTVVMVTHDVDSLWQVTDSVAFLGEGKILAQLPMPELMKQQHPLIKAYLSGPRSKRREDGFKG